MLLRTLLFNLLSAIAIERAAAGVLITADKHYFKGVEAERNNFTIIIVFFAKQSLKV